MRREMTGRETALALAALVFLYTAIAAVFVTYYRGPDPDEIVMGGWHPGEPPYWVPEQRWWHLEASLLVCQLRTPDSPEIVC